MGGLDPLKNVQPLSWDGYVREQLAHAVSPGEEPSFKIVGVLSPTETVRGNERPVLGHGKHSESQTLGRVHYHFHLAAICWRGCDGAFVSGCW